MKATVGTSLDHALKEWAVAVDALAQGETILLLRKGGIREQEGKFTVAHACVWLYPTYEHQRTDLLKPNYLNRVQPVTSGWHPATVTFIAHAEITHIFQVSDAATVAALLPFHIWNERFVTDRFHWKPRQPLYVLLLRTYQLNAAQTVAYQPEYGGCKSWIDLVEPLSVEGSSPVLSEQEYHQQVEAIASRISSSDS